MPQDMVFWFFFILGTFFLGVRSEAGPPSAATPVEVYAETTAAGTVDGALAEVLALAPVDTTMLMFTDWELIKRYEGAETLTSADPLEARLEFLRSTTRGQAAASVFAAISFQKQADAWGWDTTDLRWEATLQIEDQAPVYVMRLRDDFDMDILIALFEEREFERTERSGAILFTHPLDPTVDWRTEMAVFNAAILPEQHILIHASTPDALQPLLGAKLDESLTWSDLLVYVDVAAALDRPAAAILASGPMICTGLEPLMMLDAVTASRVPSAEDVERLRQALFGDANLAPYLAFGVGYHYAADRPQGLIAMRFPDAALAAAQVAPRAQLARNGNSIVAKTPYSEVLFTLDDAAVQNQTVLLRVRPVDDMPKRLFDMVYRRDMTFAACMAP